jgi:hypothetical protein
MSDRKITVHLRCVLLASLACLLAGCPGPQAAGEGEEDEASKVVGAVTVFSDLARSPETFPQAWAGGNAPDEKMRKEYQKFYQNQDLLYEVGDPQVEGNQATVDIVISNYDDPDTPLETITWSLVKEGEEWKLQEAPLPTTVQY